MTEIKATAEGNGVTVKTSYDGEGIDVLNECMGAVKAMYEDMVKNDIGDLFLAELGATVYEWVKEYNHKGGENLA